MDLAKIFVGIGACLGVAACGGSGSVSTGTPISGGSLAFTTLVSEANRLSNDLATAPITTTLPSSGGATYQGVVVLADDFAGTTVSGVIGTANLTANFSTPTISGTGTGFYSANVSSTGTATGVGTPVNGSLNFSGTPNAAGFPLGVDGTVEIGGAARTISGSAIGGFYGTSAQGFFAGGVGLPTTNPSYDVDIAIIAD